MSNTVLAYDILTHICWVDSSTTTLWTGPFSVEGMSGYISLLPCFIVIHGFNANNVDPDQMQHMIWVCTICQCLFYGMPDIYWLKHFYHKIWVDNSCCLHANIKLCFLGKLKRLSFISSLSAWLINVDFKYQPMIFSNIDTQAFDPKRVQKYGLQAGGLLIEGGMITF